MTSDVFISRLLDIVNTYKTIYGWGTFGWIWNKAALDRLVKAYPSFYTPSKRNELSRYFDKEYFAFDCAGLIKGVLWGWNGDQNKKYGGAVYLSNDVPDNDANVMFDRCSNISGDFSKIDPGEAVWMQGHIGIYIGEGKVIECTPDWEGGVQLTAVRDIWTTFSVKYRKWEKHGNLPWIT